MDSDLQRRSEFVSFDGSVRMMTRHQRPDRYRHLDNILDRPLIARGGGYAYSAASFGTGSCVLEMTAFDRMLDFDPARSELKVEAGARLVDVCQWAIRHGLQVPVIPGYPLVTIGGCIAADVHGKNPWRDGTFADWVRAVTIFHPDKGYLNVDRESDPGLFEMTCGGFGLTGVIVDATLELTALPGADMDLTDRSVHSFSEAIELLAASPDDFCYSWHDATTSRTFGRGLVTAGRWILGTHGDAVLRYVPMTARTRAALPMSLWNSFTVRVANTLYYRVNGGRKSPRRMSALAAAFPLATNRGYLAGFGRSGLRELQIMFDDSSIIPFIHALENLGAHERKPLIMASLKRFHGRQRSLSPSGAGYLIAMNFLPGQAADRLMAQIDELMLDNGGQPNLSKDSRIGRDVASRAIRNYATFAERLRRYDPSRRFCSELSERIGL